MGKCNTIIIKGQGWGVGGSLFRMEMHALLFPLRMCQMPPNSKHSWLWGTLGKFGNRIPDPLSVPVGEAVPGKRGRIRCWGWRRQRPFQCTHSFTQYRKAGYTKHREIKSCWNIRTGRAQLFQLWFPNLTPDWRRSHPFNTLLYRQMAIIWRQPKIGKTATVLEAHLFLWPSRLLLKCQLGDSSFSSL